MTDVFRKQYRDTTEEEQRLINSIKELASTLHSLLEAPLPKDERCMALAKTKLEEAVMWAVKGLTA